MRILQISLHNRNAGKFLGIFLWVSCRRSGYVYRLMYNHLYTIDDRNEKSICNDKVRTINSYYLLGGYYNENYYYI